LLLKSDGSISGFAKNGDTIIDRSPELNGFRRFRRHIAQLPLDPLMAIGRILSVLDVPEVAFVDFLHRSLMSISGWSA
jgi:uncharacterized protein YbcC (UPF0753/DUF2309 family)